jgi:hypothetical protein
MNTVNDQLSLNINTYISMIKAVVCYLLLMRKKIIKSWEEGNLPPGNYTAGQKQM